jgi:hypothetical protein
MWPCGLFLLCYLLVNLAYFMELEWMVESDVMDNVWNGIGN